MSRWMVAPFLVLALLLGSVPVVTGAATGMRVVDGDTLVLGQDRIRLLGIDAPESGQLCTRLDGAPWACGAAATVELSHLIARGGLTCAGQRRDIYGRRLARCRGPAGDLGQVLVARGLATAFGDDAAFYVKAERQAADAGLGIWENPAGYVRPHPDQRTGCAIKGNISRSGAIYHMPGQRAYAVTTIDPDRGERWFCHEADAVRAGWRPARD